MFKIKLSQAELIAFIPPPASFADSGTPDSTDIVEQIKGMVSEVRASLYPNFLIPSYSYQSIGMFF